MTQPCLFRAKIYIRLLFISINETEIEQKSIETNELVNKYSKITDSNEIRSIKRSLRKTNRQHKRKPNKLLETLYAKLKKDLRRAQRRDMYLRELKEINNLNKLAKQKKQE